MLCMDLGIQNFKDIIDKENSCYIDKTQLIEDVLLNKVTLYTRPRRFGKTLNMSMLYYFFSNKEDSQELFKELKVSSNKEVMKLLNQYPVINISFGGIEYPTLKKQISGIGSKIRDVILSFPKLRYSESLSDHQKNIISCLEIKDYRDTDLEEALVTLSQCLYSIYQKKVMILIDEYDVPLNHARNQGYYDEFYSFYSIFLSKGLKYNDYLERGVLTGCLGIVKDSMFTGLNNVKVHSITDTHAGDCFGFTQDEVDELLRKADLLEKRDIIREWYDGYQFGNHEIYNPWSVSSYIDDLQSDYDIYPKTYWLGTSANREIYDYIKNSDEVLKEDFRKLVDGETITRVINMDLSYRDLEFHQYKSENIYSYLLYGGYLKILRQAIDIYGEPIEDTYDIAIPNKEISRIYIKSFNRWFSDTYPNSQSEFIDALLNRETNKANEILNGLLFQSVSYYSYDENYYKGYIIGLMENHGYRIQSEGESGLGRFDIFIYKSMNSPAILIECKYTQDRTQLKKLAYQGIHQIIDKKYIEGLNALGYKNVIAYCISFYKKECHIEIVDEPMKC